MERNQVLPSLALHLQFLNDVMYGESLRFDGSTSFEEFLEQIYFEWGVQWSQWPSFFIQSIYFSFSGGARQWIEQFEDIEQLVQKACDEYATFEDESWFIDWLIDTFPDLRTAAHEEEAYSKQARANKKAEKTARKLARKAHKEAEKQAELKVIEQAEKKAIEQAENEAWGQALRRSIKEIEKRCNITISEIDGAFRFGSITFNNTFTHTEGQLYTTKEFKRSRKSRRVRFAKPRVNKMSYSPDFTTTKAPTEATVQNDAEAKSTAVVEDMKHIIVETSLKKEEYSKLVEEILASGPGIWITPIPKIISTPKSSILTATSSSIAETATFTVEDIVAEICFIEKKHHKKVFEEKHHIKLIHVLSPLPIINTSLNIDFNIFNIEQVVEFAIESVTEPISSMMKIQNIKSFVIFLLRKKINLSPFKELTIRSNSTNWARVSKPSIVVADVAIEKTPNTNFYERKQVLSPCSINNFIIISSEIIIRFIIKLIKYVIDHITKIVEKSFAQSNIKNITKIVTSLHSVWIYYHLILSIFMVLNFIIHLFLINKKWSSIENYKKRSKIKIKLILHHEFRIFTTS